MKGDQIVIAQVDNGFLVNFVPSNQHAQQAFGMAFSGPPVPMRENRAYIAGDWDTVVRMTRESFGIEPTPIPDIFNQP